MTEQQLKNQHLMWRAGFGPAADGLAQLATVSTSTLYKALQKASAKSPDLVDATDDYLKGLFQGIGEEGQRQRKLDADDRKNLQQQSRKAIRNLNLLWIEEMVDSDAQLREKMAFFWHGHFAARNLNVFFQQGMLDVIRRNALGNFRDLLREVSKSAAMLNFLNANQNRKGHPNENFAREVMELFTMGRGNYKEADVKEAARSFTGWGANAKGEFVFRKFQHDAGSKTVLGRSGNFDGDAVLDILLEQKATAYHVTAKVYKFFVNETLDMEKVDWLATRFYNSNYAIEKLMEDIFTSDWFYDKKNRGTRIKSPVELLVGLQRMLPMQWEQEEAMLLMQRVLGQILFYPPNVAGWPGGKSWIDSSTLMMRMRLPQLLTDVDEFNIDPKRDDDQMMGRDEGNMGMKGNAGAKLIKADIAWERYLKHFESIPREGLLDALNGYLLQIKPAVSPAMIKQYADSSGRESFIKTATIQIMSTPEYQLC